MPVAVVPSGAVCPPLGMVGVGQPATPTSIDNSMLFPIFLRR
jgi:hypothetical protein